MSNNKKKVSAKMKVILSVSAAGVGSLMYHGLANAVDRDFGGENIGQAGAKILQVMTTAQTAALNFGEIVPAITAGTVTISSNGAVSSTTNQLIPNSGAGIGSFSITGGNASHAVSVNVDSTVSIANPSGDTMTITLNPQNLPTTLGADGAASFGVIGSIAVGANQAPGVYTGTYDVDVIYS
jgi:hypothetical protein